MTTNGRQGELFERRRDDDVVAINGRCRVRTTGDGYRVVEVSSAHLVLAKYEVGDTIAEAHAIVSLVEQGWAYQKEVAAAFGRSARTVRRYQRRYEEGGVAALEPRRPRKDRSPRQRTRNRRIVNLMHEGVSKREVARRMGIDEKTVRNVLRRVGWVEPTAEQLSLGMGVSGAAIGVSAEAAEVPEDPERDAVSGADASASVPEPTEQVPFTLDRDAEDRCVDRALAARGLLDDAAPLFSNATAVPGAAVLLAVPALMESGVIEMSRKIYGSIGPAFYGLRTAIVTLVFMALLRIKCPENLKEHDPRALGRTLGLDRAPELKTVRRKLARLTEFGRAKEFGRALAKHRASSRGAALGFLYVDGHVRVYHGTRKIPKGHVGRLGRPKPATTDYWCNDAEGEPLFVVPTEAHKSLVKMLPPVLEEARSLVGERRTTVVFDRGGWSPKLFRRLIADGFDIITYRKGRSRKVAKSRFEKHEAIIDGRKVCYTLADQGILLLKRKLRLRQVTILREDGGQTPIITSRRDLSAIEVAHRMIERWKQENFFKYLREEFALDALVDYGVEAADASRDVPNPERKKLNAQLRAAYHELENLQARYGLEVLDNPERQRKTMRGFKIANSKLGAEIEEAMRRIVTIEARRAKVPTRIAIGDVVDGPVVKLAVDRKHVTDLLKMVAYQLEGDLLRLVKPHYRRSEEEGRTLVQAMLSSAADIEVAGEELRVRVAPLSSPHKTQVLAAVCEELNQTRTVFPGTRLRLRFMAQKAPEGTPAFPGPRPPREARSEAQPDISGGG